MLGDPEGLPLFFFHGTPGSRLVLTEGDLLAQVPGLRLILPERPGYGLSDPKPDRTLLDWPEDVAALADHLGLDRFAVAGVSGGGPHALACAYGLAHRVSMALLLASSSPAGFRGATKGMAFGNRLGLWLSKWAPGLVRRLSASQQAAFERDPEGYVDGIAKQMAPSDRRLMADPKLREAIIQDLREAYRQGSGGAFVDGQLAMTARTWGFALSDIAAPVYLWHGEADTLAPKAMAEYLANEIPTCRARYVPDAGHLLTESATVAEEMRAALGL